MPERGSRLRDVLVVRGYLLAWRLVRILPERLAYRLFDLAADVTWRRGGASVRRLEANLSRLTGSDASSLTRPALRSYLRYWCEAFRLPAWSLQRTDTRLRTEGPYDQVRAAITDGRGVVAALAHSGNWDHAGSWASRHVGPLTTVAERLKPEQVAKAFLDFRRGLGMEILNLGDPAMMDTLEARLRGGGFVPLLSDRDLGERGLVVDVPGGPAKVAAGPALLAHRTGAMLVGIHLRFDGPDLVLRFSDPIDPASFVEPGGDAQQAIAGATQAWASWLWARLAEHPQDWHMLQRVYLEDLPERSRR